MRFRFGQSRSRLVLAVVCLVAAALAVGLVYVPGEWLARAGDALQAASTYLLSFGERSLLFALGAALVVLAALLVLLPRRRPHAYWADRPSTIAPISVYVDAENQLQNAELVRPFVRHLRTYLAESRKGQRADLLYFADAREPAYRPTYEELYRFGFRPIDVPHVPFKDEAVKDAVDMELSLHAFDRGLYGGERQHFIFVTGDRDFLPLVFRLSALGHTISLWAANPPQAFLEMQGFLDGVKVFDLNEIFPPELRRTRGQAISAQAAALAPRIRFKAHNPKQAGGKRTLPHGELSRIKPAIVMREGITFQEAVYYTRDVLHAVSKLSLDEAAKAHTFRVRLGNAQRNFLLRLGYDGGMRVESWLEELAALGVLRLNDPNTLPAYLAGDGDSVRAAAVRFTRFTGEVCEAAIQLARTRSEHIIFYTDISARIAEEAARREPDDLSALRALTTPTAHRPQAHVRYVCLYARKNRLLRFEERQRGSSIQVTIPDDDKHDEQHVAAGDSPEHGMAGARVMERSLDMRDEAGDTGTS